MGNNLTSAQSLAYQGTNAASPSNVTVHYNRPTANYYQGFQIGDFWVYRVSPTTNANELWVLMGVAGNVANWVLLSTSTGAVLDLQGNTGGPVGPTAGVINVIGAGDLSVAGNPATSTLTISLAGGSNIVSSLTTDDTHVVTPTAGTINLHGGNNITTTGTVGPNTATINVSGTTNHALQIGNATGSLTSLSAATNGQIPIGSTGADPVISTITAGSNITVTNGAGSITIAATNPGGTVTTLHTDDGHDVTQTAGVINVAGAYGITTTGTVGPNTVTVNGPAKQAAFLAYLLNNVANVTGDTTPYFVVCDTVGVNNGGGYDNTTGKFTAPVTGVYSFSAGVTLYNMNVNHTFVRFTIGSAGGPVLLPLATQYVSNPYADASAANTTTYTSSIAAYPMNAGEGAGFAVSVSGGTKTVGIYGTDGAGTLAATFFSGCLIG